MVGGIQYFMWREKSEENKQKFASQKYIYHFSLFLYLVTPQGPDPHVGNHFSITRNNVKLLLMWAQETLLNIFLILSNPPSSLALLLFEQTSRCVMRGIYKIWDLNKPRARTHDIWKPTATGISSARRAVRPLKYHPAKSHNNSEWKQLSRLRVQPHSYQLIPVTMFSTSGIRLKSILNIF